MIADHMCSLDKMREEEECLSIHCWAFRKGHLL